MVDDSTTINMGYGTSANGSSMFYHDSSLSNGGAFQMNKDIITGSMISSGSIESQKVLRYDAAGTGSHLAVYEDALTRTTGVQNAGSSPVCLFASGSEGGTNQTTAGSASMEIMNANTLQLTTFTHITPGDLQYSVSANTSLASGNYSGPVTIRSSFTYENQTLDKINRVMDRSMVSGLFDLFTRVYRGGDSANIQAQTQASGMVSSKTVVEHEYAQANGTSEDPEWRGNAVYYADIMTNGGTLDEKRTLSSGETIESRRMLTYLAHGSTSMQTEEKVVAVKKAPTSVGSSTTIGCVFTGGESNTSSDEALYQSVSSSSRLLGVDSAQISSASQIDMGIGRNGTMPLQVDYTADIRSPVQFDETIVQVMTDPDKDGRYEDLNGNKKQDMQDLVLLFKNFEWLSKSSISARFDYNNNGKVDLADLTHAFKDVRV
jgi:PKD repeat protein